MKSTPFMRQGGTACPISPGLFKDVFAYAITGGTGRFAGATGSGTSVILAGPGGGAAMFDGTVSSPGSLR